VGADGAGGAELGLQGCNEGEAALMARLRGLHTERRRIIEDEEEEEEEVTCDNVTVFHLMTAQTS